MVRQGGEQVIAFEEIELGHGIEPPSEVRYPRAGLLTRAGGSYTFRSNSVDRPKL
jgi:hypothetical protein